VKDWIPLLGSFLVALGALGGVLYSSQRADAREREKHRRDQLVAAVGELLGTVEETARQALALREAAADYQRKTGELPMHLGKVADEVAPAIDKFSALATKASIARYKVELLEPRLELPAMRLLAWCLVLAAPAVRNRRDEVHSLRKQQHAEMDEFIKAYRVLP
jgi:hypothetical protein